MFPAASSGKIREFGMRGEVNRRGEPAVDLSLAVTAQSPGRRCGGLMMHSIKWSLEWGILCTEAELLTALATFKSIYCLFLQL